MSKLTQETKTALLNELCLGDNYGKENCRRYFSYVSGILDRNRTLLIGDTVLSDQQLDDLYGIASSMYSRGVKRHSDYSVAITVLAIVNLCRDFDLQCEDNFYGFIQKKLFGTTPRASDWLSNLKIYDVMKMCFGRVSKHKLFGTEARTSYYSTILCHAFAPKSSFFALLDALWFIHNDRVDDTYFEEDLSDIADAFKAFFSWSKDENAGISVGRQSYAIRSGLRYCAFQDRELFIGILKRAFKLLSLYYDNGGEDDENRDRSYFVQLFEEWYHKKQSTMPLGKKWTQVKREPTVRDYRTAKIKYAYDSNKKAPYLAFPQMRLTGYSEDRPVLIIKVGEQILETRNLELGGNEFLRVIRPFRIELTKYDLQSLELSLIVMRGKETLYDSMNEFKRNLLIFSGEKEIVGTRIEKGFYTAYFLGDGDDVFSTCRELCKDTCSVQFEVGDDFEVSGKQYHIIDSSKVEKNTNNVSVIGRKEKGVHFILDNEEIPIYSSIEEINLNKHESHGNLRIKVNGKNYAPDRFSVIDCTTDDHCLIRIWDSIDFSTQFKCILIKGFRFSFDRKYYYDKFDSSILRYSIGTNENEIFFRVSDEHIEIPYLDGKLEFRIPYIAWLITGENEQIRFAPTIKPLWYETIKQTSLLKIYAPSNVNVEAYNFEGALRRGDEPGTFLIGQSIWGNENKQSTGVDEIYTYLNGKKHRLCEVAYYPQITQKPQIEYYADRKMLYIDYSAGYVGFEDARFAFEFDNGDCLTFECSECPASYHLQLEKDLYKFRMYWLKKNNAFGFGGLPKKVLVYESDFTNGKPEEIKFARKTLMISEFVDFNTITNKLGTEYFLSNIRYCRRMDGFEQHSCKISRDTWNGLVTLYKGFIEIIKNGECLLYFYDKEFEGLSEFIFRKGNGFIYKEQGVIPTSQFISCNYLKYEEVD